jgi:cobalt-zinc-cadmium efflux system membrane fusion protein
MSKRSMIQAFILAAAVSAVVGCGREGDAAAAPADAVHGDPAVLTLEPAMAKEVKVEDVVQVSLPITLKAFGKIQFNEDRLAAVLAPLPGQVGHLAVKVGDPVRKGQVLFTVSSRDIAAAVGEYIEAGKDLELAEKTCAMTKDLFENHAASGISLRQAENDLAKARSRAARTRVALAALGVDLHGEEQTSLVPVRAPLEGTITDRKIVEGQYATGDGTALMTIADLRSLWIVADLFERDLPRVAAGQKAEVTITAYPSERFPAQVERVSDVVDPVTRTIKVRLVVSNETGRLKPEMFASILLTLKEAQPTLTVPSRAVFTEGGRQFVYVEKGPGRFERRRVEVQPGPDDRLRVQSGLQAGDRVASEDVMLLRAQSSSGDAK